MQRRLVAKRDRYEEGVRQIIFNGIRSGELIEGDPALATRAILGALNSSVLWFRPDGRMSAADIAREFSNYLVRGLLAKTNGGPRGTPAASTRFAGATFVPARSKARAKAR